MHFLKNRINLSAWSFLIVCDCFLQFEVSLLNLFAIELSTESGDALVFMMPDRYDSVIGVKNDGQAVPISEVAVLSVTGGGDEGVMVLIILS